MRSLDDRGRPAALQICADVDPRGVEFLTATTRVTRIVLVAAHGSAVFLAVS
jgi:hypothetical protein